MVVLLLTGRTNNPASKRLHRLDALGFEIRNTGRLPTAPFPATAKLYLSFFFFGRQKQVKLELVSSCEYLQESIGRILLVFSYFSLDLSWCGTF